MDPVHLHLMLNHLPVVGMLFAMGLLAFGLLRSSDLLVKTAFGALVFVALVAIPAYMTGEPAEEIAEKLPEVSERVIEPHEEAAKFAIGATLAVGTLALAGLVKFRRQALPPGIALSLLALSVAAAGTLAWTANLGGRIRHPEIRGDAAPHAVDGPRIQPPAP